MKIGQGYDIHKLAKGEKLLLGGVSIPFDKGGIGHSDGDALLHAITDALLGAAALGDIGSHFSDLDPKWKDAPSSIFLNDAKKMLDKKGLKIENIDSTIHLEKPKMAPQIPQMRKNIAEILGVQLDQISIKAKRGEGMDAVGRGEAVAAQAIVLLT